MSDSKQSHHHILPLSTYFGVGAALLVLTGITVLVAQFDFGPINLVVAMAIAAIKGTLVALFFMHLKYDNKLYLFVFVGAILFLALFIVLTMFDTQDRDAIYEITAKPINDKAVIYRQPPTPGLEAESQPVMGEGATTQPVDSVEIPPVQNK